MRIPVIDATEIALHQEGAIPSDCHQFVEVSSMLCNLENGLYRVTTKYFCAGFEVKDKKIINCAPILRNRIQYWVKIAEKIG